MNARMPCIAPSYTPCASPPYRAPSAYVDRTIPGIPEPWVIVPWIIDISNAIPIPGIVVAYSTESCQACAVVELVFLGIPISACITVIVAKIVQAALLLPSHNNSIGNCGICIRNICATAATVVLIYVSQSTCMIVCLAVGWLCHVILIFHDNPACLLFLIALDGLIILGLSAKIHLVIIILRHYCYGGQYESYHCKDK